MDTTLAQYRIVHFATHGALAGELAGTTEPGLVLTPPNEATADDDGYLSASEIAGLKLDADWVILFACNTAAGGAQGAEALSGLARAFFYPQARTLLVSHWAVDSLSTVKLITSPSAKPEAAGASSAGLKRCAVPCWPSVYGCNFTTRLENDCWRENNQTVPATTRLRSISREFCGSR